MSDAEQSEKPTTPDEIVALARTRFNLCVEAESEQRRLGQEDARFSIGEQWPESLKASRDKSDRPCLTINKVAGAIHQVTNDQRQNRPAIKVSPVDDQADIETAKVFQGHIRSIEYNSDADIAYDTAEDSQVRRGYGFARVITEYCDSYSFNQDIKIKAIRDPDTCYLGPHQQPDGSDASYGFVIEDLAQDDFKAQFPKSELCGSNDWAGEGARAPGWIGGKSVRVAEYFTKTFKEITIQQLSNGEVIEKGAPIPADEMGQPLQVTNERQSTVPAIKWYKINGLEVLEETDWPGLWIPIIPFYGNEIVIDGEVTRSGMVRPAMDAQRMYNYQASNEAEAIALAPRAPWIVAEGQIDDYKHEWANAQDNPAYLTYKPTDVAGTPIGPPTRNVQEPAIGAINQSRMLASDDIKSTTNVFDAALGNRSNENSGVAIQRRANQSQTGNFHYADNASRSKRHIGRILVDLIPKVKDTAQTIRTLGEDGVEDMVLINQIFEKNGQQMIHNLGIGKYDVTVSTGPSYQTKRQEAAAIQIEMAKADPTLLQIAGDIIYGNMDWPGAKEIAERKKKTLPPGLDDDKEQAQIPPEMQAQMQQMGEQMQMLQAENQQLHQEQQMKAAELESKERIEMSKIQANIAIEEAKLGSTEALAVLNHQMAEIQAQLDRLHMADVHDVEREHAMQDAEAQRQFEMEQNRMAADSASMTTGGLSPGDQGGYI